MTEYIYHLTATELRDLMTLAIAKWQELDRDVTAAVDAALEADDAKRLGNSLPFADEDTDEFDFDGWYPEHVLEIDDLEFDDSIPFNGSVPATVDDDPAIPDSWYTINTSEFIATVDRETNQIDYEDAK